MLADLAAIRTQVDDLRAEVADMELWRKPAPEFLYPYLDQVLGPAREAIVNLLSIGAIDPAQGIDSFDALTPESVVETYHRNNR